MPSSTTSSPGTSPDPLAGLVLGDYRPSDSDEAVALERLCAQGRSLRLSFRRTTFHRRAEGYAVHRLFTARAGGALVGVSAGAVKEAEYLGRRVKAGFGFDLRVHPAWRSRGLGARLFELASGWCLRQGAEVLYTYTVAENRTARALVGRYGVDVGGYAYLVYPAYRRLPVAGALGEVTGEEVHAEALRRAGPLDFACDPFAEGRREGLVGSWIHRGAAGVAGCSAWTTRGVLAEVVERLPAPIELLRRLQGALPPRWPALPWLPARGEELRSWYLFDLFATTPAAARDLLRAVAARAQDHRVDWCYLVGGDGEPWRGAARSDVPRLFTRAVPYRLLMARADGSRPAPVRRLYVDVRDL